ncbi:PspC domain-containing protein [Plesiomonas shigelloides subsp. oncorhynchi]|nr:PspC domain-containing protein [Plesiomonas shigelloides]
MVITVFLFGGAGIVILAYLAAWLFMDKYTGEGEAVYEEPALKSKTWQAGSRLIAGSRHWIRNSPNWRPNCAA